MCAGQGILFMRNNLTCTKTQNWLEGCNVNQTRMSRDEDSLPSNDILIYFEYSEGRASYEYKSTIC